MTTFAALGIPFPLFEGPVDEAAEYAGAGHCFACAADQPHCFTLGIGAAVIVPCPRCATPNGLDADDRANGRCRKCRAIVRFPEVDAEAVAVCHACLRAGRAAMTKNMTIGMVAWDDLLEALAPGRPILPTDASGMVPLEAAPRKPPLPLDAMQDLLQTPSYVTWQEEQWELCCSRPMVYLGRWTPRDFDAAASSGDGRALFAAILQNPDDDLWKDAMSDSTGIYVFRCPTCGRKTANWDLA